MNKRELVVIIISTPETRVDRSWETFDFDGSRTRSDSRLAARKRARSLVLLPL